MYNKKYLKAKKKFNTKESFQCFIKTVMLFDSVYRKDGNYYPKVFIHNFSWKNVRNIGFGGFGSSF